MRPTSARVEVDSGVSLVTLARDCIERGYAGLEWAIGVPGTVGGAVVGNAGAHGSDVSTNLHMAKIMRRGGGAEWWTVRQLAFEYRRSALKAYAPQDRPIVLAAQFDLKLDYRGNLEKRAGEFNAKRKATQPPGANDWQHVQKSARRFCRPADRSLRAKGCAARRRDDFGQTCQFFHERAAEARATDVKALIDLAHATRV